MSTLGLSTHHKRKTESDFFEPFVFMFGGGSGKRDEGFVSRPGLAATLPMHTPVDGEHKQPRLRAHGALLNDNKAVVQEHSRQLAARSEATSCRWRRPEHMSKSLLWETKFTSSQVTKHIYIRPIREIPNVCGVNVTFQFGNECPTPLHGKDEETPHGPDGQADKANEEQV